MPCFDIALGDGKQAGQLRFRGEQVIAIAVQRVGGNRKADRQQVLFGVQQESELHLQRQLAGEGGHRLDAVGCCGFGQLAAVAGDDGCGPEGQLAVGAGLGQCPIGRLSGHAGVVGGFGKQVSQLRIGGCGQRQHRECLCILQPGEIRHRWVLPA